jgi:nucleoid DNA-binding protein
MMPLFLKLGQTIRLEGFGTFRISVSSEGTGTADELSGHNVRRARMIFQPSVELKRSIESLSFEIK